MAEGFDSIRFLMIFPGPWARRRSEYNEDETDFSLNFEPETLNGKG